VNPDYTQIVNAINRLVDFQQKGLWDIVNTVAIIGTLCVLVWYTIETFRLRQAAQKQLETAQKQLEHSVTPIVTFHSVRGDDRVMGTMIFKTSILVIRNLGSGPAFNVEMKPLLLGDKTAVFIHTRTLAPDEASPVKIAGLLGPTTQDSSGQVSGTMIEQTGQLRGYLGRLQDSGETHGEITYASASGRRYHTSFTMNHTLDAESFVIFDSAKAV
jgi:hypothetical protein